MLCDPRAVTAYRSEATGYPHVAPFHPDAHYRESPFRETGPSNAAYSAVRDCLRQAGLDDARYGTAAWNPLRGLIQPGETVLLKPNLVKEEHPRDPEGWRYVITHGSVIRAVADFVWKALEGCGQVMIADAPQTDSSFEGIRLRNGLDSLEQFYRGYGLACTVVDLRREEWVSREGVVTERRKLPGDPLGYSAFDLDGRSEFTGHSGAGRYYGADYDDSKVNAHHSGGKHEYLVANTALHADVVISLPKLKTHKKAGITVSLKNLVGINGDKNWLPHHTEAGDGAPGDERPDVSVKASWERRLVRPFRRLSRSLPVLGPWLHRQARRAGMGVFGDTEETVRSGNWWGNDTTWRMCLDLNKILLYGRPDGHWSDVPKRHFVLVDGIVAGEGRGPMNPDPVTAGLVVFGTHAPSVDAACAVLMGFDPERIPIIRQAFRCRELPLASGDWMDVSLRSNVPSWQGPLSSIDPASTLRFQPHFGWKGHIEKTNGESDQLVPAAADPATTGRV